MWKHASEMAGYEQQDAHEFFISLLDGLHLAENGRTRDAGPGAACACVIHKVFAGVLRSDVVCQSCRNVSTCTSDFLVRTAGTGAHAPCRQLTRGALVFRRVEAGRVQPSSPSWTFRWTCFRTHKMLASLARTLCRPASDALRWPSVCAPAVSGAARRATRPNSLRCARCRPCSPST